MEEQQNTDIKLTNSEYTSLQDSINSTKFNNRLITTIGALLMSFIIFLLGSILTYQKKAYTASIDRYDYNHTIDQSLEDINSNIADINSDLKEVKTFATYIYSKDTSFYNNEFKPSLEEHQNILHKYIMPTYKLSLINKERLNNIDCWREKLNN